MSDHLNNSLLVRYLFSKLLFCAVNGSFLLFVLQMLINVKVLLYQDTLCLYRSAFSNPTAQKTGLKVYQIFPEKGMLYLTSASLAFSLPPLPYHHPPFWLFFFPWFFFKNTFIVLIVLMCI